MTSIQADIVADAATTFDGHISTGGTPAIEWGCPSGRLVVIISSQHPNSSGALRDWAHKLLALAADVDARSDTREPSGYDAPVPYALATSPRMPEGMADRGARS